MSLILRAIALARADADEESDASASAVTSPVLPFLCQFELYESYALGGYHGDDEDLIESERKVSGIKAVPLTPALPALPLFHSFLQRQTLRVDEDDVVHTG